MYDPATSLRPTNQYPDSLATDADADVDDRCELEFGQRLAPDTARRIACDASLINITEDEAGNPLDIGRKTRAVPPAIHCALKLRDGGCRFPGCTRYRFVDAHHIRHWATAATRRRTISSCYVAIITGWCTRAGSASNTTATAIFASGDPMAASSPITRDSRPTAARGNRCA